MNKKIYEKSLNGQVIYIRHAQSAFNIVSLKEGNTINNKAKWSKDYIDARISDEGRSQAELLSKSLSNLNFTYVFVSPLIRCIETLYNSLKNLPNYKNLKIFVHPEIHEIVESSCDFSMKINEKKEMFSSYNLNWKYFDEKHPIDNDYYFLDYLETHKDEFNYSNYDETIEKAIAIIKNRFQNGRSGERLYHIFNRGVSFKKFLKEFVKENNIPSDEKVLVFTHSAFIRSSTVSDINEEMVEFPLDSYHPQNCEALTIFLD